MITLTSAIEILETLGGHPENLNQTGQMSDQEVLHHQIEQACRLRRDRRRQAFWAALTKGAPSGLALPGHSD